MEAHDHDSAPEECDGSEEYAGANLSHDDRRRWLADDVWDEEDEGDDTVSVDASGFEFEVAAHSGGRLALEHRNSAADWTHPAMLAALKLVRSIKLMQYMAPRVSTRRRSTRCMMLLCSLWVKQLMRGSS